MAYREATAEIYRVERKNLLLLALKRIIERTNVADPHQSEPNERP